MHIVSCGDSLHETSSPILSSAEPVQSVQSVKKISLSHAPTFPIITKYYDLCSELYV